MQTHRFQQSLLAWFDQHGRSLPWRETRDPYRVWVSEIMLQQTRVAAAIPYYQRWLARFPTLEHLADADIDDVLKMWEGLGYYSRARNLHAAARVVRERHAGEMPDSAEGLRTLPGIGDYTAGAIASIVYGHAEPAVDGNVRRVMSRLLDRDLEGRALRTETAALVSRDRPGEFNQALMELGATVCTPRSPECTTCPVTAHCAAYRKGTQKQRPAPKKKPDVPVVSVGVAVLRDPKGRILLTRRPDTGLLAGMWELPARTAENGTAPEDAALGVARTVTRRNDVTLHSDEPVATVRHVFSHRIEEYQAFQVAGTFALRPTPRRAWYEPQARANFTLPRGQQRLLHAVLG
ncbi:MAG TPA: A/G-specific adenine glycosylase [Longimicrobiales bacterium]|nr:A/G-specific adenine glycosylase [Longimicrobiales bacterium]